MFRFSIDEFVARTQREKSIALLEEISKTFIVEHCPEIEKFFDDHVKSYEFLEELPKLVNQKEITIAMSFIPYDAITWRANADLTDTYRKLNKSVKETTPFIEFSFPENYKCKHGVPYKDVFIFFVTKFNEFENAQDYALLYLNKLNNLKAFL